MKRLYTAATVVGSLFVAGMAADARAALVASDSFEQYTAGQALANNGNNGGTGFSSAWGGVTFTTTNSVNVVNSSLSYTGGSVSVSGGTKAIEFKNAAIGDPVLSRQIDGTETGTLYFSFLFKAVSGVSTSTQTFFQFTLNDNTVVTNSGSATFDATPAANKFGARVGTTNGGSSIDGNPAVANGDTMFLVGKLSKSTGTTYNRLDLFINPTTLTEPGSASAFSSANSTITDINYFTIRTVGLASGNNFLFDHLTIGDSYVSVIPEPTSLGLLAAGATMLLSRRRSA